MFYQLSEKFPGFVLENAKHHIRRQPHEIHREYRKETSLNVKPKPSTRDIVLNTCYILDTHSFKSINGYKKQVETFIKNMYFFIERNSGF